MKIFIITCAILICIGNIEGNTNDLEQVRDDDDMVFTALFEKLNWLILETKTLKEEINSVKERLLLNENLRMSALRKGRNEVRELFRQQDLKMQQLSADLKQQIVKSLEQQTELYKNTSAELLSAKTFNIRSFKESREWQCILRRQDGSVNFERNWQQYKEGFGQTDGEYFIGLEKLHAKTTYDGPQELLIILQDFNNETRYARYDDFVIGSEKEKYKIKRVGTYHGDAVDSFSQHLNANFSTEDEDNDETATSNCAKLFKGGWWFKSCYSSHLTGPYVNQLATDTPQEGGVIWSGWHGSKYSLKFVEMHIKLK